MFLSEDEIEFRETRGKNVPELPYYQELDLEYAPIVSEEFESEDRYSDLSYTIENPQDLLDDEQWYDDINSTLSFDEEDYYDRGFTTLGYEDVAELILTKV